MLCSLSRKSYVTSLRFFLLTDVLALDYLIEHKQEQDLRVSRLNHFRMSTQIQTQNALFFKQKVLCHKSLRLTPLSSSIRNPSSSLNGLLSSRTRSFFRSAAQKGTAPPTTEDKQSANTSPQPNPFVFRSSNKNPCSKVPNDDCS